MTKKIISLLAGVAAAAAVTVATARDARADLAAVWASGHGGFESSNADARDSSMGGLGFQLGARLFLLESYFDRTGFGDGAAVSRGVIGLRGGIGRDVRLVLRAGVGVLHEEGGALTGRMSGTPDRTGGVARIGAAVDAKMAPALLLGFGVDGERFSLPAAPGTFATSRVTGTDVFASLRLTFELGV